MFSDAKVVEASKKLIPIIVDCDWGKKNRDLSTKYNVRGYPTVVFTDPDGQELDRMGRRDVESVVAQIEGVEKHGRKK